MLSRASSAAATVDRQTLGAIAAPDRSSLRCPPRSPSRSERLGDTVVVVIHNDRFLREFGVTR